MSSYPARLARARRMVALTPKQLAAAVPVGLLDQYAAAGRDAHRAFLDVSGVFAATVPGTTVAACDDRDRQARLLAAVLGCSACTHLWRTPAQPAHADLNLRLLLCRRCVRTYRRHLDDDRCEVCDSQGHSVFRESLFRLGQVLVHGNVAECCLDLLIGEEVQA